MARSAADRDGEVQALFESAQRLEALLQSAVEAIVTIDARGVILSVNPATEKMFGYAAEELQGTNVKVLMPSPYRGEHDAYVARYLATGEKRIIGKGREVEGRRKDGSTFPVDLAVSEVVMGSERIFMGTLRDLSDRKLLELSLLQSQKMEAIGRLAGGVSHDFNTLLGTITGYAEMLRDASVHSPQLEAEHVRQVADKIHQAASRGADLTRQLLAFSRRQEVRPKLVDVQAVTRETGDMIRRLIGEDIDYEHEVDDRVGRVSMDPGQLQQVLLNLALNSADAMPRGGRLCLRWSRQRLAEETPMHGGTVAAGAYAKLEVTDSGTGMEPATLERIFEPFFTTKAPGKGTGLGLSTVFGIVRQWRGGIRVSSAPNEGTRFQVFFPEADGAHGDASSTPVIERPSPPGSGSSETVLLVEDDAMFRELVAEVLTSSGYRVLTAGSPREAQALWADSDPEVDILVSDVVMPDGSGVELAAGMRSRFPALRVILMSGYSDEALADRQLDETTADAFLEKPFAIGDLKTTIRRILDQGC